MPYESEKWGTFLEWLDGVNPEQRKLLMYSRLLPDPTNLPGVVGQAAIFALESPAASRITTWEASERGRRRTSRRRAAFSRCVCEWGSVVDRRDARRVRWMARGVTRDS